MFINYRFRNIRRVPYTFLTLHCSIKVAGLFFRSWVIWIAMMYWTLYGEKIQLLTTLSSTTDSSCLTIWADLIRGSKITLIECRVTFGSMTVKWCWLILGDITIAFCEILIIWFAFFLFWVLLPFRCTKVRIVDRIFEILRLYLVGTLKFAVVLGHG